MTKRQMPPGRMSKALVVGETVRAPPLREVLRVRPRFENDFTRRVEHACPNNRPRVLIEVDTIFFGHASSPLLAVSGGKRRGGRSVPPRRGDTPPASRRPLSARPAESGRGATAP